MARIHLLVALVVCSLHMLHSSSPKFSSQLFDVDTKKYLVAPIYVLGLANRLRTMSSLYSIAKFSGRELVVIWVPNVDCNIEFDEIFDDSGDDITVARWIGEFNHGSATQHVKTLHEKLGVSVLMQSPRQFLVDTAFNISSKSSEEADLVFLWAASSYAAKGSTCEEYTQLKHQFYRNLVPTGEVMRALYEVGGARNWHHKLMSHSNFPGVKIGQGASDKNVVVGVHIRTHDEGFDWAVVPPGVDLDDRSGDTASSASSAALKFDDSTPVEVVIAAMRDIISSHPNIVFIVASNSRQIKEKIMNIFGENYILTLFSPDEQSTARSKAAGIRLALLEFYLLGMVSDLILHSKGSSFALEASYLSRRGPLPVIDMATSRRNNETKTPLHIYKHDNRLPFCGLDDFYNAHVDRMESQQATAERQSHEKVCYQDDEAAFPAAEHSRILCTYLQKVARCNWAMEVWGIHSLYCLPSRESGDARDDVNAINLTCSDADVRRSKDKMQESDGSHYICIPTDSRGY